MALPSRGQNRSIMKKGGAFLLKNTRNIGYLTAGIILLILGLIGLALPVIPQVPFFCGALIIFCRLFPCVRKWLRGLSLYRRYLSGYMDRFLE